MVQRFKNWTAVQRFHGSKFNTLQIAAVQQFKRSRINGSRSDAVPDVSIVPAVPPLLYVQPRITLLQQFNLSIIQHFRDRSRSMVEQLTMSGL
jgi:hypothetical protein